ncbi:MAG: 1-acyl-sn-glycerol-3-phosphate acyltransferase [Chloroflexi bacterium]|jgi:1-acyl-sn-glycerol-3-phosphate acyltransferase|nr:1-acyl-sn-glycerol-3-phosphate acyltransferase [Chloroflexota bacterium]MBT5627443.1 1-acyl-sn-glycerol-3-phosphate acyltransferase [Chloroflexota bacterium]
MAQWLFPFCNSGFKTTLKLFSDFKIEGQENIPDNGPLLVASNHLSNLDPAIVAAALPKPPVFMAKKELFKYRIGSVLMRGYGAFPVDRTRADVRALNWITNQLLSEHRTAIVFPEGTRSKVGGLLKAQQGLAMIAMSTGVPIVPFALTGSEKLQHPLRVFKPTAKLRLKIGKPFVATGSGTEGRPSRRQMADVTTEIMIRIAKMLPEAQRGEYAEKCDNEFSETAEFEWSTSSGANRGVNA